MSPKVIFWGRMPHQSGVACSSQIIDSWLLGRAASYCVSWVWRTFHTGSFFFRRQSAHNSRQAIPTSMPAMSPMSAVMGAHLK